MAEVDVVLSHDKLDKMVKNKAGLSFQYVKQILMKDWKDIRYNRSLFLTMLIFPMIVAVGIPVLLLGNLLSMNLSSVNLYASVTAELGGFMKNSFLLVPVLVSGIIAGDSLAGEKERKTAETLVLLPLSKEELYIGKTLAAFIPAVIYALISFTLMGTITNFMLWNAIPANEPLLLFGDGAFWIIAFVVAPLFSFVMVQVVVMISARVSNTRAAQQLAMLFFALPVFVLLFVSLMGPDLMGNVGFLEGLVVTLGVFVLVIIATGGNAINREKFIASLN
jgi:ABC-type transport system involved in multi-copper enzyme maturation permease subunit